MWHDDAPSFFCHCKQTHTHTHLPPPLPLHPSQLQVTLAQEQIVVEEAKAATQALIEEIGQEKAAADEAVEGSRADEEAAATIAVRALQQLFPVLSCTVPLSSVAVPCCAMLLH